MKKKHPTTSNGFTLIEILVSSAILVILAAGFLGLQFLLSQNQVSAWRNYQSIENANLAVTTMARELKDCHTSDSGSYPLVLTNDQEIIFYSDVDFDNSAERVRYTLSGTTLTKGIIEPVGNPATYPTANEKTRVMTDIVRNGANPIFYYYNSNWPSDTTNNPLPPADRISDTRMIQINLNTNPKSDMTELDYTLVSEVRLRMIR